MEQLGLSRPEYQLLTDTTLGLHGLYGYASLADAAALTTLQNQSLQDFSRRLGVSYSDLLAIVQTRFVNPNSALIPLLQQLYMPFSTLQNLQNGTLSQSDFEAALPPGINSAPTAEPSQTTSTRSRAGSRTTTRGSRRLSRSRIQRILPISARQRGSSCATRIPTTRPICCMPPTS